MTRSELESLGLTDDAICSEYRRIYDRSASLPKRDDQEAQALRRDVFNRVCDAWYQQSGS